VHLLVYIAVIVPHFTQYIINIIIINLKIYLKKWQTAFEM